MQAKCRQNAGTPTIAGAFNTEHDVAGPSTAPADTLIDSIANLTKVANQIKNKVKRFTPYDKKRNDNPNKGQAGGQGGGQDGGQGGGYGNQRGGYHGGNGYWGRGGRGGNGYQGRGGGQGREGNGYQGRGGPRNVSFGGRGGGNGRKCYNCGLPTHAAVNCYRPCGGCGNRYHKFLNCPHNPMSGNYQGWAGRGPRANYAIDTTSLGEDIPQASFAEALNAFHPFPADNYNGPPGFGPREYTNEHVDRSTYLETLGVCNSASVLKKNANVSLKWYMDGGASHHFTPHRQFLFDYVPDSPSRPVYVRVATHQWVTRAGTGSIKVHTTVNGKHFYKQIKNVWHVPSFAHSLLSVNMLKEAGCWGILGRNGDKDDYYFDSKNNLWLVTKYNGGLNSPDWKLEFPPDAFTKRVFTPSPAPTSTANFASPNHATDKETPTLWHQRLGHVDMMSLNFLVLNKKVSGIKVPMSTLRKHCNAPACKICVMAKHNRSPFHGRKEKATEILHTVHSDVCGPYPVPSLGGGAYVVTLVDEFSGKADVSVVKTKDVVGDELRRMILEWENTTGKTVKFLFSDRGGEYVAGTLSKWCASKGIKHNFSVPRTPEQNGVAERLNQTLNNIVRSLLFQYKLYLPLWGHAMVYACMLYNVRLHKHLKITHEEAFTGKIPNLSNFRTFGCLVYARVADSARKKLDPKSQQGIFLGPEPNGPGYKILTYNEKLKRDKYQVRIFRDIVTYETLKSVCGVHDESQLFWGGNIDLPEPQEVEDGPLELEPLTGVPELPVAIPQHQLVVPPQLVGAGERVAQGSEVLRLEGPLQPVGEQQGRVAPMPSSGTEGLTRVGRASHGPVESSHVGGAQQSSSQAGGTTGLPKSSQEVAARQPTGSQAGGTGTQRNVQTPISTRIVNNNPPMQTHARPSPYQPVRVVPSNINPMPISRVNNPPMAVPRPTHKYTLRKRPNAPQVARIPHGSQQGIKRAAPAMQAYKWSPLMIPKGHSVVIPTAFTAFTPYAPPDVQKHDVELPTKESMVENLLRYFHVEDRQEGNLPIITEAYKEDVPKTLKQAMATKYARFWAEATVEEWLSIMKNDTWVLIDREPWMKVIPCKWVYTIKTNQDGVPVRFKARLVAGGHKQTEGVDYNETYAPVSRLATLRTMLAVAARRGWKVHQLDIKTAFLNGKADTTVYMQQAPGFVDGMGKVVKLRKCLYGLKQAPRVWYLTLCDALRDLGLKPISADSSFWVKEDNNTLVYMTSVVDDILITSESESASLAIKQGILKKFDGHDCGEAIHYNGIKITWLREEGVVILSQPAHIQRMLEVFGQIEDLNEFKTLPAPEGLRLHKKGSSNLEGESPLLDVTKYPFRVLMGSLNYVGCTVRPDIVWIVNQLSRYSNAPTVEHWKIAINVLKYLKYTINWGICLGQGSGIGNVLFKHAPNQDVVAFADANHGTGIDDKKSITGYVLQVFGGPVSWGSKVQHVTALSTTESEFRALSTASREALWLAKILKLFGIPTMPFLIKGDNKGSIDCIKSYNYTKNNKHVQIRHDFMRDYYMRGELAYEHISGKENPADIFTKALGRIKFEEF
jgi:hypothetical protein